MLRKVTSILVPSLVFSAFACGDDGVDIIPPPDGGEADSGQAVDASRPPNDSSAPVDAGTDAADANVPDPCATDNGGCGPNALCTAPSGTAVCTCKGGFSADAGDAGQCEDIDECATNNGGCSPNATCTNTGGGRTCTCNASYEGGGETCTPATTTFSETTDLGITNTGSRTCADGGDMVSYSVTELGATSAKLSANVSAGCLSAGDEILLLNVQGTADSAVNTGHYERLVVSAVNGDTVTFTTTKTKFFGAAADSDANIGLSTDNQRVVVQRIPSYGNIVLDAGVSVTAPVWDGTKGGIFALRAVGTVTVNGTIHMDGKGYRGGGSPLDNYSRGQQGESIRGLGALASTDAWNGGGGGGPGDGSCYGHGVGGTGGGYGTAGALGPKSCLDISAAQSLTYGDAELATLHLGSGGGSGGNANTLVDNPPGGHGGRGGGLVYIIAADGVSGTGMISARGGAGQGDAAGVECRGASQTDCWDYSGPGGGGSGGSVLVTAPSVTVPTSVSGGVGGNGHDSYAGDGGHGGAGRSKTN